MRWLPLVFWLPFVLSAHASEPVEPPPDAMQQAQQMNVRLEKALEQLRQANPNTPVKVPTITIGNGDQDGDNANGVANEDKPH